MISIAAFLLLIYCAVFIFGTLIGSFLNVVIFRYNTGAGIGGRSGCFSCGHALRWYELIPVLSYVALRGRCSECKSRISPQYPLVELATGVLFVLSMRIGIDSAFHFLPASLFSGYSIGAFIALLSVLYAAAWSLLTVIFAYDLRHKIIPDGIVFLFAGVSLLSLVISRGTALLSYPGILDLLAGPLLFLPFYLLWKFSEGKWIGLGDGKLALGIGWFLGFVSGISAIVIGFWIGAAVMLAVMAFQKLSHARGHIGMKSEIPFAPFLILGILAAFIFRFDVFGLSVLLSL